MINTFSAYATGPQCCQRRRERERILVRLVLVFVINSPTFLLFSEFRYQIPCSVIFSHNFVCISADFSSGRFFALCLAILLDVEGNRQYCLEKSSLLDRNRKHKREVFPCIFPNDSRDTHSHSEMMGNESLGKGNSTDKGNSMKIVKAILASISFHDTIQTPKQKLN